MAGWVADKPWLLIMVLQIDSENSATGMNTMTKTTPYRYLSLIKEKYNICIFLTKHFLQTLPSFNRKLITI